MRRRWIGWSIVACVAATATYAESSRRSRGVTKVESAKSAKPDAKPEPKAEPRPEPRAARPDAKAKADADADAELAKLADDPLLARADRIGGGEVRGMVAFTFDDGPNPETTPHVIAALQKYDVPATFFVVTRRLVGRLAAKNREVLAKALAGGFEVASHSVSHTNLEHVSTKAIRREIDQSLRVLSKQAGRPIGLFRAPFGALDDRGREHLKKRGLTEVKWSIDPMDWRERDGDLLRKRAIATILAQDGGVVLMHDAKEVTAKTIGLLLDDLEAANCQRLVEKKDPILPVSLHYWIRDNGKRRRIPDEVKKRTLAYRSALPGRCAARAKPAPPRGEDAPLVAGRHARPGATVAAASGPAVIPVKHTGTEPTGTGPAARPAAARPPATKRAKHPRPKRAKR